MNKKILPLVVAAVFSFSFAFAPLVKAGGKEGNINPQGVLISNVAAGLKEEESAEAAASSLYSDLDLSSLGLSFDAMKFAYKGYEYLRNKGALGNNNILTVVDFSQNSRKKRMYIIDVTNREVLLNTYVAHGKNTGLDVATKFSNTNESLQSSLGFYVTKGTYIGKHGLSLKLDGKEPGFNSNAESRAVVLHGADYIGEHRKGAAYMGRSFGCPAVPQEQANKIIHLLKNGSTLFIYHPSAKYLNGSKILNG